MADPLMTDYCSKVAYNKAFNVQDSEATGWVNAFGQSMDVLASLVSGSILGSVAKGIGGYVGALGGAMSNGFTYSALTYEKVDDDFGIIFNATNKVFLNNQFSSSIIESIKFSDGTTYTWEQIHQNFLDKAATAGSDYITGHSFNESVKGGAGNDYLLAARGDDTYRINQNEGYDVVSDSSGADTILFGSGISKSNIQFGKTGNLLVINLPGGTKVYVDRQFVTSQQIETFKFNDGSTYTAAEVLQLIQNQSSNNQTLTGTSAANTLNGGVGDDTMQGSSGSDRYEYKSGDGSDLIYDSGSSTDIDKLIFGTGLLSANLVMTRSLEDNDDVILSFKGSAGSILLDRQWYSDARYGVDEITFGNGEVWNRATFQTKYLQSQITTANDVVFGLSTNDTLAGGTGNDRISGQNGNDSISGDAGSDTVLGDDGNDTVNGGTEDDYLLGGSGNDSILGGAGADRLFGESNDDIIFGNDDGDYVDGGSGIDTINGDNGNDTLVGGSGNDIINGLANDDSILGGTDSDKLYGNLGNDTLYGESGNDTLEGNEENDVLFGGAGIDLLTGGAGKDYFVFQSTSDSSTSSPDKITDFVRGTDKIIFEDDYFTGIRSGTASGSILGYAYETATNLTVIKDAGNTMRIELVGNVALSKSDFYFSEDLFDHL